MPCRRSKLFRSEPERFGPPEYLQPHGRCIHWFLSDHTDLEILHWEDALSGVSDVLQERAPPQTKLLLEKTGLVLKDLPFPSCSAWNSGSTWRAACSRTCTTSR